MLSDIIDKLYFVLHWENSEKKREGGSSGSRLDSISGLIVFFSPRPPMTSVKIDAESVFGVDALKTSLNTLQMANDFGLSLAYKLGASSELLDDVPGRCFLLSFVVYLLLVRDVLTYEAGLYAHVR
jgi:hypothetical protein